MSQRRAINFVSFLVEMLIGTNGPWIWGNVGSDCLLWKFKGRKVFLEYLMQLAFYHLAGGMEKRKQFSQTVS